MIHRNTWEINNNMDFPCRHGHFLHVINLKYVQMLAPNLKLMEITCKLWVYLASCYVALTCNKLSYSSPPPLIPPCPCWFNNIFMCLSIFSTLLSVAYKTSCENFVESFQVGQGKASWKVDLFIPGALTLIYNRAFVNSECSLKNSDCCRFYCGDQDKLFKEAHLVNPLAQSTMKKVQRSSRSSSASTSTTCCDICFQSPNLVSIVSADLTRCIWGAVLKHLIPPNEDNKHSIDEFCENELLPQILERGMDWQRYPILYTTSGPVILNKPETNIAQLAMVIMRMNEIEFMSIITIQVGQCLLPVCPTEDKI